MRDLNFGFVLIAIGITMIFLGAALKMSDKVPSKDDEICKKIGGHVVVVKGERQCYIIKKEG